MKNPGRARHGGLRKSSTGLRSVAEAKSCRWSRRAKGLALEVVRRQAEYFSVKGFLGWVSAVFSESNVAILHEVSHYGNTDSDVARITVKFKLVGQLHDPHTYMDLVQERVGKSAVVTGGSIECPEDADYAWGKVELKGVKLIY